MKTFRKVFNKIKEGYPLMLAPSESEKMWAEFGIFMYEQMFFEEDKLRKEFNDYKLDRDFILEIIVPLLNAQQRKKIKSYSLNQRLLDIIKSYEEVMNNEGKNENI